MKPRHVKWSKVKEVVSIAFLFLALVTYEILKSPAQLRNQFLTSLVGWHAGVLTLVMLTAKLMEHHLFRNWFRCSFLKIAMTRIVIYLLFSTLIAAAGIFYYETLLPDFNSRSLFWSSLVFYALIYFATTVAMEVSKLVGKGFVGKLLLGNYHRPKTEMRIFLFIDLKESTRLSKELSLEKYSYLITEFFRDIDKSVEKYGGEIYQYAGDEVIVSWPDLLPNYDRAVLSFLEFYKEMKYKRPFYIQQYGVAPRFKAAMHSGKVVGTWVGRMKRELVFQGEVLNITARITSLAKNLTYPMLLTQQVADKLTLPIRKQVSPAGSYSLKGIKDELSVYFLRFSLVNDDIKRTPRPAERSVEVALMKKVD